MAKASTLQVVQAVLAESTPEGDFDIHSVSELALKRLRDEHPMVLEAWLDGLARDFLHEHLAAQLRQHRSSIRHQVAVGKFTEAVTSNEAFDITYVVDESYTRRRLRDMTAADHRFVADRYHKEGNKALMQAAFHRQVAKKLRNRRTGDVFTPETYNKLMGQVLTQEGAQEIVA